jgi:hypothetical protein
LASISAFAQSTVTITGLVDMGTSRINLKGAGITTAGAANGSATSNIVIGGLEQISNDLSAGFRWEIDPDLTQTAGKTAGTPALGTTSNVTSFLSNGYSFLGLKSKSLGEVQFGTLNYATLSANGDGNGGFGTAIGSGYRVTSFDAVRAQNSASYETPAVAGFAAKALIVTKNSEQNAGLGSNGFGTAATGNAVNQQWGRDGAQELSLSYVQGPLTVRYADLKTYQNAGTLNGAATVATIAGNNAQFDLKTLSAKYTYQDATVSYFYQKAVSDAITVGSSTANAGYTQTFNRKTNGAAISYAATPLWTVMANYQKVSLGADSITLGSASPASVVSPVAGASTTVLGLGVDYALSKRTTAYFRTERDNDQAIVRAVTGYGINKAGVYTASAIGVRHAF